ncbi:unnamed protein product, partial [Meganyctiphanes norvegica]
MPRQSVSIYTFFDVAAITFLCKAGHSNHEITELTRVSKLSMVLEMDLVTLPSGCEAQSAAYRQAHLTISRGKLYGPLSEVRAVVGGRILLGCDVSTPDPKDTPILVLFYSGARGTPIYSIDARSGPFSQSVHWSDLGARAHFDVKSSPSGLVIDGVNRDDDGDYRCRVDFRASPTRNVRVRLHVIVPPDRVRISTSEGDEVSGVIGPFPVNKPLELSCATMGGHPRPKVSWWHEGRLLDDESEVVSGDLTRNTLRITDLSRDNLYKVYTCQAANSNLSIPLAATVTLDLSFPPVGVAILGSNEALSVGESYSVVCEAKGSRPPSTVTWWKDQEMLTDTKDEILSEGSVSRSTLNLRPKREDNGAVLSCRAENPSLPATAIEDQRRLKIYYIPKIHIQVGASLDMTDIEEGDDIYFECDIDTNPSVYRVQWFLNGEELRHNQSAGVIQSNQSLVLQHVTRSSSGLYTCTATNIEGTGKSNAVQLNVKYVPVCAPDQNAVYGGGRHEAVNVLCRVESYPLPSSFKWAFNTSTEMVDIPLKKSTLGRSRSTLEYTPQTHHDFGSLLCWAINEVGQQREPCHFHIVPAAVPDPVENCSVLHNMSAMGGVLVTCHAGWGGGLLQTFSLVVHHGHAMGAEKLISLTDQNTPNFSLKGLAPGTEYTLSVVAENSQGASAPNIFTLHTPIDVAEKQTSAATARQGSLLFLTPILGVLLGVVASLIVCGMVLACVVKMRAKQKGGPKTKVIYETTEADIKSCDDGGFAKQELTGPDIILVKAENKSLLKQKEMVQHYITAKDTSFYINPGSLLNSEDVVNEESKCLLGGPCLQGLVGSMPHMGAPPPIIAPLATCDALDHDAGARYSPAPSSGSSSNRASSTLSDSHHGSAVTVAMNPEYCIGEHSRCVDSVSSPHVSPGVTPLKRESSV